MLAGLRSTGVREIHYRHADGHPVPALATTSIIRAADGAHCRSSPRWSRSRPDNSPSSA